MVQTNDWNNWNSNKLYSLYHYPYNDCYIIDKWFIIDEDNKKSAERALKEELFSALVGQDRRVKIEKAKIFINGKDREGYHLMIGNYGSYYYYTNTVPSVTFDNNQSYEITCNNKVEG